MDFFFLFKKKTRSTDSCLSSFCQLTCFTNVHVQESIQWSLLNKDVQNLDDVFRCFKVDYNKHKTIYLKLLRLAWMFAKKKIKKYPRGRDLVEKTLEKIREKKTCLHNSLKLSTSLEYNF